MQYSFIGFDEIDQFSKEQVTFLLTCLRSEAKVDSFCVGTCNPNPDSWLLPIIEWYLDDKGFPDEDKCGKIRYFVVVNGDFVFGDSEEYFKENYPDSVYVYDPVRDKQIYIPPKTFTFINGNVFDNPALLKANPRYLSELQNLPDHERDRQLWGNWYARPTGSNYFQRQWVRGENGERVVDALPSDIMTSCRGYDKAGSEPSEVYRSPDFTAASPMIHKSKDGLYYLTGDFIPTFKDPDSEIIGRFRKRAGERDTLIKEQALADGRDSFVVFPVDSGQAGKSEFFNSSKMLVEEGIVVKQDPMANNKTKLTKFQPFAAACQNGLVFIVESTFSKTTLEAFYKELESFDGERSTTTKKDDWCDSVASAFNFISREKVISAFTLPTSNSGSNLSTLRGRVG